MTSTTVDPAVDAEKSTVSEARSGNDVDMEKNIAVALSLNESAIMSVGKEAKSSVLEDTVEDKERNCVEAV